MYASITIMVEEESMLQVLKCIIPKIVSPTWVFGQNYSILNYRNKKELDKNIPKQVRACRHLGKGYTGLIIIRDNDSASCKLLKQRIIKDCENAGDCKRLIRLVCCELESWFLGDLQAVEKAFPRFLAINNTNQHQHSNPDIYPNASEIFIDNYLSSFKGIRSKVEIASRIAPHLNIYNNRSESFNQTVRGIKEFFNAFEQYLPQ